MNWKRIVADLQKSGLSQTEIARLAGCTQSRISEIKNSAKKPRVEYETGARLVAMWRRRTEDKRKGCD